MSNPLKAEHYMKLPICGFCMNAWDMIYMRQRPGNTSCERWVEYCRVGGCDPDVWEFLDEETGWPIGFIMRNNGWPDWAATNEAYHPPKANDSLYHRREREGDNAKWRRVMPKLTATFAARRNERFQKVVDKHGNVLSEVVPDDDLSWDEDDTSVTFEESQEDDDDIW